MFYIILHLWNTFTNGDLIRGYIHHLSPRPRPRRVFSPSVSRNSD